MNTFSTIINSVQSVQNLEFLSLIPKVFSYTGNQMYQLPSRTLNFDIKSFTIFILPH